MRVRGLGLAPERMTTADPTCSTASRTARPALASALACLFVLSGMGGCGAGGDGTELGMLQAQSGPFAGDLTLDSEAPQVGEHEAELMLDRDGELVDGATVLITPFMPAHGHGSTAVEATESEPGRYSAAKISLFMPGLWELRVRVTDAGTEGRLVASFEVH